MLETGHEVIQRLAQKMSCDDVQFIQTFSLQHIFQLFAKYFSVPSVPIFVSVRTVVETIIGVREVGRVIQGQKTVLSCFKLLRELNSNLLSGFVL